MNVAWGSMNRVIESTDRLLLCYYIHCVLNRMNHISNRSYCGSEASMVTSDRRDRDWRELAGSNHPLVYFVMF